MKKILEQISLAEYGGIKHTLGLLLIIQNVSESCVAFILYNETLVSKLLARFPYDCIELLAQSHT